MYIINYSNFLKKILLPLLLLLGNDVIFSQDYLFDTRVIGVEDGLPHRNTYDIVQDKEGFIWVSTLGNISRYDGYNFKTYNYSFLNILENSASRLAIDGNNYLWYCEGRSVKSRPVSGIIDTRKDSIYSIATFSKGLLSSGDIIYISNSKKNPDDIFIATKSGSVYKYNGNFEEIYRAPGSDLRTVFCEEAPDGSYWVVHNKTLIHIKKGKLIKTIPINQIKSAGRIVSVYPDLILKANDTPESTYWILENDRIVPFSLGNHTPKEITGLFQFHKDYTCYATKEKLLVRDTQGNISYSFDNLKLLRTDQYLEEYTTFLDRQQALWITTGNGILKVSSKKKSFKTFASENSVRGIYQEANRLWIGGDAANIVKNITNGTQQNFWPEYFTTVMSFYKDHRGHLWAGTSKNLLLEYIPAKNTYIPYRFTTPHRLCFFFQNTLTKNYWIGTQKGLCRFDKKNKIIIPFPLPVTETELSIRQLYQNKKGIWIVSNKGIFLMDGKKEVILKQYTTADGLPTDNINYIYEEKQGVFWLGSKGSGLLRWDLTTNTFRQYTRKDGLSNNNIYAVYEDDFETLWLPSDYGLMAFDKNTADTKVYLPQNGIAHEEFNTHSHFQAEDGTLYFGGLNGITSFHPADLHKQYITTPPLHLNKILVLEKDAATFTDNTEMYFDTKKIRLRSSDKIIELNLTLLDYEKSIENQYAYKIEGHQEQWIYTKENTISIINPPYGRYNLIIKARGASGSWSADMLTIPVYKSAPFYLQWWFIITEIFTIAIVAFIIFRRRLQKLQKDRERLEEEVQKRTWQIEQDKQTIETQAKELKALDKAKTQFFANVTHEFRTPLTLITGPVEQMIAKKPPDYFKKGLNGVLNNAKSLLGLINQLLDLSKLEGKQMKVEVSHGDIVQYTKELVDRFQPLINKKNLSFNFTADIAVWKTHFDGDKWTKIVYNLLSNAIKFTPNNGSITICLKQIRQTDQDCIQLKVKDTGIGIASEKLGHIFNRFYQTDASSTRSQGGTGIGLSLVKELTELQNGTIAVKSVVGKGTCFTVTFPVASTPVAQSVRPLLASEELLLPVTINELQTVNSKEINDGNNKIRREGQEKMELLIIEDNAEMRAYIKSCIDTSVYHISEAADGEEGIKKAREIVPDLIISDVMMPKKNGFEVTEAIRGYIVTSHIPLILLTAKTALESRLKGLERGADAYLTKPFSPQELALRIKKLVELRKLLQQRYQVGNLSETKVVFHKEDHFIKELKTYILNNISEPKLHVETISRHFIMSRTQLYRKLKALINKPIADYIRSVRLEKALELLEKQQLSITEITYETGFSSPAHFSRSFKKAYGKTPSEIHYDK